MPRPRPRGWRGAARQGAIGRRIRGVMGAPATNVGQCTGDSIRVVPGGSLIAMSNIPGARMPPSGSVFYLYQIVTYGFMTSVDVPGRLGLWRRVGTGAFEELAAPFDTSAKVALLMGPFMQAQG